MESKDSLIGELIDGKYMVERVLGQGGMGVVYQATHQVMRRRVAIKMLRQQLMDEENALRFRREAETQARFEHPHAVTIHDYGVYQDSPYLVMQFVEGQTLKQLLREEFDQSRQRLIPFIIQISEALHEAHQVGVVHRDLKPENIMITQLRDGEEKAILLDFGIAKLLEPSEMDINATQAGLVMGTPHYMSPEQAKGKDLSAQSDLYALGVILFEICTGQRPFNAQTSMNLILMHLSQPPPSPRKVAPDKDIPIALEKVILKALEKEPENRQESVRAFIEELKEAVPNEYAERPKDRRAVPQLILAVLLCVCVALLLYFRGTQEKTIVVKETVVESGPVDWRVVTSSLDDAVEKMLRVSELALKYAKYSQQVAFSERPSEKERWTGLQAKAREQCFQAVDGYLRELKSLSGLAGSEYLKSEKSRYITESLSSSRVIPNRKAMVERIVQQVVRIEDNQIPAPPVVIATSLKAAKGEELDEYKDYWAELLGVGLDSVP